MKSVNGELRLRTTQRFEVINITQKISEFVKANNLWHGILMVYVPHTTAAVTINEDERGLINDIITIIKQVFKPDADWQHNLIDNNAHAHLASSFIGNSRCLMVKDGELQLGTWQSVLFIEMDGPRDRRVDLMFLGDLRPS